MEWMDYNMLLKMIKLLFDKLKKFFNLLLLQIHTIFLLVGIGFISVSAFLYSEIIGYLVLGVCFVVVSLIINKGVR